MIFILILFKKWSKNLYYIIYILIYACKRLKKHNFYSSVLENLELIIIINIIKKNKQMIIELIDSFRLFLFGGVLFI